MEHRNCFEALDKSLRDILRCRDENSDKKPFGGDFEQILPVVPKGKTGQIVNASIKCSYLWSYFTVYRLTQNMCLSCMFDNIEEKKQLHDLVEWILNIGDGKTTSNDGDYLIKIPEDLLLEKGDDSRETIINNTYPDLLNNYKERSFLQERAILCARNETVQEINDYIMTKLSGEEITCKSCDSVCETSTGGVNGLYPTEFLNTLKFLGIPNHELKLKVGLPVMLLRNINQAASLCNGTRMTITQLRSKYIEAQIITGTNIGDKVCIPGIIMTPKDIK
jgi:hypothetical protein